LFSDLLLRYNQAATIDKTYSHYRAVTDSIFALAGLSYFQRVFPFAVSYDQNLSENLSDWACFLKIFRLALHLSCGSRVFLAGAVTKQDFYPP
jgi:hypothetical protein